MSEQPNLVEPQESKPEVEMPLGDFDPRVVHHRDPMTRRITKINAYKIVCHQGIRYYEWPKNSKNIWYENREYAGRLDKDGVPQRGEPHVKWIPPRDMAQELEGRLEEKALDNQKLSDELTRAKKEIAAYRFEKEHAKLQAAKDKKRVGQQAKIDASRRVD